VATIRTAGELDLPGILDIYNDVIATSTAVYDYHPHTLAMRREWWLALRELDLPVIVAIAANRVIGFGALSPFRKWGAYKYSAENSLYVVSDCRGQGIGKQLLAHLIDAARDRDLHTLVAGIDASNDASIRLHRALGFEQVALFREVGFKFGRWLDLVFMQRWLATPAVPRDG
jgi:phosphinothricin acetyltransferase